MSSAAAPNVMQEQAVKATATSVIAMPVSQEVKAAAKEAAVTVQEVVQQKEQKEQNVQKIVSPMVGTFYTSPEVGAAPLPYHLGLLEDPDFVRGDFNKKFLETHPIN